MIPNIHTHVSTAEQLAALPDDGNRYELIDGVLHMMSPAGFDHGDIAMTIGAALHAHVTANSLGKVCAAETGFRISNDPDTVRAADAAFVSQARLDSCSHDRSAYLPLSPDLVVEVVSPNDVFTEVESKAMQWLAAGTQIVLVADPAQRSLRVYRGSQTPKMLGRGEIFEAGEVCGGWQLPVDCVFD